MSSETSQEPPILYEVSAGVATITLNRPERKNSLSEELVGSLSLMLDRAIGDDAVRVVVVTNTGNTFCAGADLKSATPGLSDTDDAASPGEAADEAPKRSFVDVFAQMLDSPKPVVGRIDGHATGGGVGLVAACDISVMRADAKIGFTEVRIGVAPAVISVVCLPKMTRADALELFLTGDRITPARAAEIGLINRAVEPESLDETVDDLVGMCLRGGPDALAAAKDLVFRVPTMERDAAFAWTAVRSRELFESEEASVGIAAFRDRVDAPWVPAAPVVDDSPGSAASA
ncbi:MAG: enoyl-CoA hydratase-related protein [Actinomycetota bacterium]